MAPLEQYVLDNAQVSDQAVFFFTEKYFREWFHVIRARTRVTKSLMKQLMAIHIEELIQIFGIKLLILFKARLKTLRLKIKTIQIIKKLGNQFTEYESLSLEK